MATIKIGPLEGVAGHHTHVECAGVCKTARQWADDYSIPRRTVLQRITYFDPLTDDDFMACLTLPTQAFRHYCEQSRLERMVDERITLSPLLLLAHGCPVAMRGAV